MIFTLEALQAKHGDSLLLHFGEADALQLMIIDGGPAGVFERTLKPRLQAIKQARSPDAPLPVRLIMLSHIDDDHIRGLLDLTDLLIQEENDGEQLFCDITTLWFNGFDDIVGNDQTEAITRSLNSVVRLSSAGELIFPPDLFRDHAAAAIAANVPQGRRLRDNAERLDLRINDPFPSYVAVASGRNEDLNMTGGLSFRVVAPNVTRLENLQTEWNRQLGKIKTGSPAAGRALAAELIDNSVYNLSSIVVLAEAAGKKMLLTGDALGADIIQGLQDSGHLQEGRTLHVDLLKMPHHGSIRDVNENFFRTVTADNYVFSANGKYDNPDLATLELLSEIRGHDKYTVFLTNPVEHAVRFFEENSRLPGKRYNYVIRQDPRVSIRVDLADPLPV